MKKKLKYINNDTIKCVPKVEIRIPAQPNMGTVGIYDSEGGCFLDSPPKLKERVPVSELVKKHRS